MSEEPYTLHLGDSREVLKSIANNSVDSCVCDPPYSLVSIAKRFGKDGAAPAQFGKDGLYARASAGFMGCAWDNGETAFDPEFWAEVLRVLKPGGHLLAFSGTRTYHRMTVAIEDAGFEIRDQIGWAFGSGFPKSHSVSKAIDRVGGDTRYDHDNNPMWCEQCGEEHGTISTDEALLCSACAAEEWEGWGTALKPAWEPICVARKPLIGTVAENVLAHGTGALNIDGCRVPIDEELPAYRSHGSGRVGSGGIYEGGYAGVPTVIANAHENSVRHNAAGRWPANLITDGSDDVVALFPESAGQAGAVTGDEPSSKTRNIFGLYNERATAQPRGDSGSAARFFYCAKASATDRTEGLPEGKNVHPTVKPTALMQYLCRLVTPPGGIVLDPFMGSGSTGKAAMLEGFRFIGIEREAGYMEIAQARVAFGRRAALLPKVARPKTKPKPVPKEQADLFAVAE